MPWVNVVFISVVSAVTSIVLSHTVLCWESPLIIDHLGGRSSAALLLEALRALLVSWLGVRSASNRCATKQTDWGLLTLCYAVGSCLIVTAWWVLGIGELGWHQALHAAALVVGTVMAPVLRRPEPVTGRRP